MPTITQSHLRTARKKRAERRKRMIFGAMVLLGAAFILLGSALTFIYPKETSDHYDNLRCVQLKENDEGFEECVKW
jgi:hypothetical protein